MNNPRDTLSSKEQLQEILSREEFKAYEQQDGENPILAWMERMWQKLLGLFPEASLPSGTPKVLAYVVLGLVLAAIGAAMIWLVRSIVLRRRRARRSAFQHADELGHTYVTHWRESEALAAAQDYAEAIRRANLALLLYMHEQEWIRAERWKTNDEYQEELQDRYPAALPVFTQVSRLFEHVWYGGGAATDREFRLVAGLLAPYMKGGGQDAETE